MKRQFRLLSALAVLAAQPVAAAADEMTTMWRDGVGLPMKPADAAAGPWTLHSRDHAICTVHFSAERGPGNVYGAAISPECGDALPPGVAGWKPVTDGLALVGADGATLLDFNQWTPSDLIAHPPGGAPYLELKRR